MERGREREREGERGRESAISPLGLKPENPNGPGDKASTITRQHALYLYGSINHSLGHLRSYHLYHRNLFAGSLGQEEVIPVIYTLIAVAVLMTHILNQHTI